MKTSLVTRRRFIQSLAVTGGALAVPSVAAAYGIADISDSIPIHASNPSPSVPEVWVEYCQRDGFMMVESWSNGLARLVRHADGMVLEAQHGGPMELSGSDFHTGRAQQEIDAMFGPNITEQVVRELTLAPFSAL